MGVAIKSGAKEDNTSGMLQAGISILPNLMKTVQGGGQQQGQDTTGADGGGPAARRMNRMSGTVS